MDDFQALRIALSNMDAEEGAVAKNALVWGVMQDNLDGETKRIFQRVSKELKQEQKERGVFNPTCGELMAAECLFWAWLATERGNDGTD